MNPDDSNRASPEPTRKTNTTENDNLEPTR
uniref:Uncharacterized protein n=1 Tax=Ciona intestinalis TaxID=7719 RepID=H2XLI0_CIOIN